MSGHVKIFDEFEHILFLIENILKFGVRLVCIINKTFDKKLV